MSVKHLSVALLLVGVLLSAGCGTMGGGSQLQNAVYDTHRRVSNLDKNLEDSITKLNENSVELTARMDANDQELKTLQSTVEENTVKLGAIEKSLSGLKDSLYRYFRLSSAAGGAPSSPSGRPNELSDAGVQVVPPAGARPSGSELPVDESPVAPLPPPAATPPAASPAGAPTAEAVPRTPVPASATPAVAPAAVAPAAAPEAAPATPMSADAEYQRARRSYASGDKGAALEQFSTYLDKNPNAENAPIAQYYKGVCLHDLGKYEEAIAELEKLCKNHPDSARVPTAMFSEGICHKQLGQTERAKELFQEVMQNYPMTAAADQAKSELRKLQGN